MRRGRMNEESWRTIGFSALFSPSFSSSASKGTQLEWGIGREEAADGGWEWEGYYPTVRCEWRAPLRRHKRAEAERRPCWKRAGHRSFASGTHAPGFLSKPSSFRWEMQFAWTFTENVFNLRPAKMYTLRNKGTKAVTVAVPFLKEHFCTY